MFPGGIGRFEKIFVQGDSIVYERALVREMPALVYKEKLSVFIYMWCGGEDPALQRTHFPVAAGCRLTFQEIDLTVPAFGEFVVFGILPAPTEPVFATGEEFLLSGQQIETHRRAVFGVFGIVSTAYAAAEPAAVTANWRNSVQ